MEQKLNLFLFAGVGAGRGGGGANCKQRLGFDSVTGVEDVTIE